MPTSVCLHLFTSSIQGLCTAQWNHKNALSLPRLKTCLSGSLPSHPEQLCTGPTSLWHGDPWQRPLEKLFSISSLLSKPRPFKVLAVFNTPCPLGFSDLTHCHVSVVFVAGRGRSDASQPAPGKRTLLVQPSLHLPSSPPCFVGMDPVRACT